MCTNFIAFLKEEEKTVDMCPNFNFFLQEEIETVDMCADFILFFRRGKILLAFVLMLLFFL